MAGQTSRLQVSRDSEAAVQRKAAEFQEAPGETEAEAVRDAFLKGAGPEPEGIASALSGADGAARARAIGRLQRQRGNAFVQRVVAESQSLGRPGRLVGLSQSEMVEEVGQRKGGGSPLPEGTRAQMEGFFGADLSDVRVHTDGTAAALSRELNAHAFTVGRDVFFAEGRYSPASTEGQATLAHELTHVGQQTGFSPAAQRATEEEAAAVQAMAVQREGAPEEEEEAAVQAMAVQREGAPDEEEEPAVQTMALQRQRQPDEEEEPLIQRQATEEDEALE